MSLMQRLMAAKMNPKPLVAPRSVSSTARLEPGEFKFQPGPVHPGKAMLDGPDAYYERPKRRAVLTSARPPEPSLAEALSAMPLPAAPAVAPAPSAARGSCKCINADTGRQCALPALHPPPHRHGRTSFLRVAAPGATSFTRRDALDAAASSTHSSAFTTPQE